MNFEEKVHHIKEELKQYLTEDNGTGVMNSIFASEEKHGHAQPTSYKDI
jgi:hypothetical protein